MSGETNIQTLLHNLKPRLHKSNFVFTHIPKTQSFDWSTIEILGMFQEDEGTTLIISKNMADTYNLPYESTFSCITLEVHSSLHAVGLTAAVSKALAQKNIPANMIAAYHHDHIFIPEDRERDALEVLKKLSNKF